MAKRVITQGDDHYLETDDSNLVKISVDDAKVITGFNNVEEAPLEGQVIGDGKFFESDGGTVFKIIPADN
jgi:hypothetical protein